MTSSEAMRAYMADINGPMADEYLKIINATPEDEAFEDYIRLLRRRRALLKEVEAWSASQKAETDKTGDGSGEGEGGLA